VKKNLKGFSLIEMAIVFAIIGLLMGGLFDIKGNLPWASLALNFARHDVWGNSYRYQVDKANYAQ
jgi:prepilin-type N-terminal cleavage/methylation domain-containing protein